MGSKGAHKHIITKVISYLTYQYFNNDKHELKISITKIHIFGASLSLFEILIKKNRKLVFSGEL